MDAALATVAVTAGTTLVTLTVTAVWQRARTGATTLARRLRHGRAADATGPSGSASHPSGSASRHLDGRAAADPESVSEAGPEPFRHGGPRHVYRDHSHASGDPFAHSSDRETDLWQESVRTPRVESPPRVFRGREELRAALTAAAHIPGTPHVLHGMGGSGKTALAAEIFRAAEAAGLTGLWVVAADRAGLRRGMLAVAAELGAEPADLKAAHDGRMAAADLVWRHLARAERWLLVIDKADHPELLDGWLRSSRTGAVLVTTRRARAPQWQNATLHRLDVLPPEDAARVITDFAPGRGTPQDALDLANRLGRLPLALRLAGSYLERQALETWSLNDYRARFERDGTELADQGAELPFIEDAGAPATEGELRQRLSWTWQITLDDLDDRGLPEATTLLRLLSCWSQAPVPRAVLSGHHPAPDAEPATGERFWDRAETALRALLDNSLVSAHSYAGPSPQAGTTPCLQVHGLVLESVHAGIEPDERPEYLRTAVHLLGAALPGEASPADFPRLRLLVPHVAALLHHVDPATCPQAAALGVRTAQLVCEAGDYRGAVELATLTGDVSERLRGPDHPDTMAARHHQGDYLRRLGAYHAAEHVLRRVHARRAATLGTRRHETLETAAALSSTLFLMGRSEESLTWIRRAIDGQRRTLGNDHAETLRSRAYALEFLAHAGRTETFLRDGPATIADAEHSLGADHVVTAIAYSNYAYGLLRTDTPKDVKLAAAERALQARVHLYGEGHPLVHSAKLVLSWARSQAGDHMSALALMREALDGRERFLGASHPLTVKARVLYAERLSEAGDTGQAARLLQDNLPQAEALYGPHDLDVQRATELQRRLTAR
ncbi:tetratricopeptide repeat protein [Actinacidiphila acidipaludis]|uniref:Tetratricopeptide repeat protein n=1 Tax=Actinacidiphila acidipaludis TaxID=2873382 RepID=A0ABS7QL99_9ACTN|nr:tetratricopeptide repeat protein [Streptomyces acidipaludis]MBY8882662.1 tetratricopeptide repeat protein [Streptomyces acidipaludis]